ncbi:MAG TPA: ABC transporter permease [Planctomycetota bacterium]|nr:ABC transporter permease [Planctomycetota bacterium]
MKAGSRQRRGWWRWPSVWGLALFLAVGLFAPLLANNVPLLARVGGKWSFPAFTEYFDSPSPGPNDMSWKQWWSRLPNDADDFAVMPPWPYGPAETDAGLACAGPCFLHPLGNDDTGRDVLARLVHGAGTTVGIGGTAVLIAGLLGTLLGALAGLRRGFFDGCVQRAIEVVLCFPSLLFFVFAASFFGSSRAALIAVMALMFWTSFARIVRGELLSLRERDFVLVARGLGIGEWRLLTRHMLPQVTSQIGVTAAFCMAGAIVGEATLSFLGVGPGQTVTSWGTMLRQGSEQAPVGAWHLWVFPTAAIVAMVGCCHSLADRLRGRHDAVALA